MDRRALLAGGGALAALAALGWARSRTATPSAPEAAPLVTKAGGLRPDPARILDLPEGFTYSVLSRFGDPMSDGLRTPALPDGMGCFPGVDAGTVVLLRNHELDFRPQLGLGGAPLTEAYDKNAHGGVTRLVVELSSLSVKSSNAVLTGTLRNCSGGVSPWGWLSCEESVLEGHGYVFACSALASRVAPPQKLAAYGRFNHEAVAIDEQTYAAYLTEDQQDGCLYRFLPSSKSAPWEGQLAALAIVDKPGFDTGAMKVGDVLEVSWVPLKDVNPSSDTLRQEARAAGAAIVRRGEGAAIRDGVVYFSATSGGPIGRGQILMLRLGRERGSDRLQLLAQSESTDQLDMPDNLALAPWGDLYLAEDGSGEQLVRCVKPNGRLVDVARNAKSEGEIAGVCFSPQGDVLFLNLQVDGLTLAVRGPFQRLGA